MRVRETALTVALAAAAAAMVSAQQPTVEVDGDDITLRGCVTKASGESPVVPKMLVWSRGDILLAGAATTGPEAANPIGTSGLAGRVLYWLEDDEDLAKHIGQEIEVKGDLEDFEEGEVEIRREGEYTEIELDLGGKEEKIRVPNAWLVEPGSDKEPKDTEYKIVGRRIDVDDIRIIGACKQ
jgi:hypothetical protein